MSLSSIDESIEYLKCMEIDDSHGVHPTMKNIMDRILELIKNNNITHDQCSEYTDAIIDSILFTRDIKSGRGLQTLAFSYLFTFQQYFPMKAVFILYMFVNTETDHQIGCWRDVRDYCDFIAKHSQFGASDTIIKPIIGMYNNQIMKDNLILEKKIAEWEEKQRHINVRIVGNIAEAPPAEMPPVENLSFAARWVPRNKKKYRWLFDILVQMWAFITPECKSLITAATTEEEKSEALIVCKRKYEEMITRLSKELDR